MLLGSHFDLLQQAIEIMTELKREISNQRHQQQQKNVKKIIEVCVSTRTYFNRRRSAFM